jgi:hypothetical protein
MRVVSLLLTIVCAAGMAHAQNYLDCHFAPGWEQMGTRRLYTADNLYDYKDGGAEGYLVFSFVRMESIDCKSGGDTLSIDISDMTDADSAFGIFSANRDPKLPVSKIGMGGQIQAQSASFAKGKYYVEITEVAADPNADKSATLRAFASKIEGLLEGQVTTPETLEWFPKEGLTSARLIPESVLGMRLLKRGYVAKYAQGQAFVVAEDSPESAAEVLKKVRGRFDGATDAKVGDEGFQARAQYLDGICIFRKGRYLAGYANMADPAEAAALAVKLATRIP